MLAARDSHSRARPRIAERTPQARSARVGHARLRTTPQRCESLGLELRGFRSHATAEQRGALRGEERCSRIAFRRVLGAQQSARELHVQLRIIAGERTAATQRIESFRFAPASLQDRHELRRDEARRRSPVVQRGLPRGDRELDVAAALVPAAQVLQRHAVGRKQVARALELRDALRDAPLVEQPRAPVRRPVRVLRSEPHGLLIALARLLAAARDAQVVAVAGLRAVVLRHLRDRVGPHADLRAVSVIACPRPPRERRDDREQREARDRGTGRRSHSLEQHAGAEDHQREHRRTRQVGTMLDDHFGHDRQHARGRREDHEPERTEEREPAAPHEAPRRQAEQREHHEAARQPARELRDRPLAVVEHQRIGPHGELQVVRHGPRLRGQVLPHADLAVPKADGLAAPLREHDEQRDQRPRTEQAEVQRAARRQRTLPRARDEQGVEQQHEHRRADDHFLAARAESASDDRQSSPRARGLVLEGPQRAVERRGEKQRHHRLDALAAVHDHAGRKRVHDPRAGHCGRDPARASTPASREARQLQRTSHAAEHRERGQQVDRDVDPVPPPRLVLAPLIVQRVGERDHGATGHAGLPLFEDHAPRRPRLADRDVVGDVDVIVEHERAVRSVRVREDPEQEHAQRRSPREPGRRFGVQLVASRHGAGC